MVSQNLIELRALTEILKEKHETSDAFFDMALDPLAIVNLDCVFKKMNKAWEKVLGWTIDELISTPIVKFVHPEDVTSTCVAFKALIDAGTQVSYFRNRYLCKDGSYKILCWTAQIDKESGSIYAVVRDYAAMIDKVSQ